LIQNKGKLKHFNGFKKRAKQNGFKKGKLDKFQWIQNKRKVRLIQMDSMQMKTKWIYINSKQRQAKWIQNKGKQRTKAI
jgi:hypothetical protein